MPRKPMKPCCHPGCPKLTEGRYCEEHEALHRGERKSASGRGYNSKWQRARKRFLKEHPLCCKCEEEGKYVRATIVDHIKPHRGDPILFWDEENWQPLCKHHHDVKTMTEDRYQEYRYWLEIPDNGGGIKSLQICWTLTAAPSNVNFRRIKQGG